MKHIPAIIVTVAVLITAGCSKAKDEPGKPVQPAQPPQKSSAQVFIEGATGKTAVDQGKKATQQIKDISAQENKSLDEVMK